MLINIVIIYLLSLPLTITLQLISMHYTYGTIKNNVEENEIMLMIFPILNILTAFYNVFLIIALITHQIIDKKFK